MKLWKDIGFETEMTEDGSLSLRQLESVDPSKYKGESMHHSGGACAETLLIYGTPIREILQKVIRPNFLIVGLGMGYIEMTIAREALLLGRRASDVGRITTYESLPELREYFYKWLHGYENELSSEVRKTYNSVLGSVLLGTGLSEGDLLDFLRAHFTQLDDLQGALTEDFKFVNRYHGIMYDAFSSKTTPFLWGEDFLFKVLHEGAAETCWFSTYACRVSLKNALQRAHFAITVRPGFVGKRNSTLGVRISEKTLI
ncbi:MAG: hypothetical protein HUU57_10555 [Bdellovibrio sp.]|nr:hypothetical protein [Bdellovibrio sp.]